MHIVSNFQMSGAYTYVKRIKIRFSMFWPQNGTQLIKSSNFNGNVSFVKLVSPLFISISWVDYKILKTTLKVHGGFDGHILASINRTELFSDHNLDNTYF